MANGVASVVLLSSSNAACRIVGATTRASSARHGARTRTSHTVLTIHTAMERTFHSQTIRGAASSQNTGLPRM